MSTDERIIIDNVPSVQKANEVLEHHLSQLKKRGATLEDSVCEILRKVIIQAEAKQRMMKGGEL